MEGFWLRVVRACVLSMVPAEHWRAVFICEVRSETFINDVGDFNELARLCAYFSPAPSIFFTSSYISVEAVNGAVSVVLHERC